MEHSGQQYTLSVLVMDYLRKNHRIASCTREMTERAFRYMIDAAGNIEIAQLGYADAEDFQSHLIERGLSKVSANIHVKTARPVFSWAVRRSLIAKNPFDGLKLFKVCKEVHVYTAEQVQAILAAAPNIMWRARIMVAVTAGLRRSEVLNLTLDDIGFERQQLYIRPKRNTELTWHWMTKDRECRIVPLVPELNNLLVRIMLELPAGQPYLLLNEKRYWTLRRRIGMLPERIRICPDENWNKPFRKILKIAGVKKGTFHDLRRTCLTQWSRSMPYQELQRLAGHSNIETTLQYYSAIGLDYLDRARQASIVGHRGDWT